MSIDRADAPEDDGGPGRRTSGVQSVDRALDVIEALAASTGPLGVSEIARITELPQGTVHRLLLALQARGYVRRDPERKYAVGAAAIRFSEAAHQALVTAGRPYLARLVTLCGETSNLAVLEDVQIVYVAQSPSPHTLRIFAEVGRRVPAHSTAVGKVMLADLPPERATALLQRTGLPALTDRTITSLGAMRAELDRVRARGFAIDDGEQERGVRCIAVPVRDAEGVAAAFSVSGPAERFALDRAESFAGQMRDVAAEFAADVFSRVARSATG